MLLGEYRHNLDEKKRISLPSKLRKELGKAVVITRGLDHCLFIYSKSEWKKLADQLSSVSMGHANSRAFNRFMLAGATDVEVDSAGRILIADFLKDFAGLNEDVVISGVGSRVEIWDEARWKKYSKQIEKDADYFAEKLGEIGMI